MLKKVLVIQHSVNVLPGYVTEFFNEHEIPFEILSIYDPDAQSKFPANDTDRYSVIVSLGGPQGAYEEEQYPYLRWEKNFLAAQLALNRPILGICLGAQLLAGVIGGHGHLGKYGYEVGYVEYRLTPSGQQDRLLKKIFEEQDHSPLFIMHHQDSFDLPSNVTPLAYTSNNYIAAFRFGSAFGVQFHPEASFTEFYQWVQRNKKNRPELYANLDIDSLVEQAERCEPKAEKSRRLFFETWWNSLEL